MFELDTLTRQGKKANPAPDKTDPVDDDLTVLFVNEDASMHSCDIGARPGDAIGDITPGFWLGYKGQGRRPLHTAVLMSDATKVQPLMPRYATPAKIAPPDATQFEPKHATTALLHDDSTTETLLWSAHPPAEG